MFPDPASEPSLDAAPGPGMASIMSGSRGRLRALLPQHALDHFDRARAAVTVSFGGTMLGTAARTVGRVSPDPPRVMVAVEAHPRIVAAIDRVGSFALNLIGDDDSQLVRRLTSDAEIVLDGITVVREHRVIRCSLIQ